MFVIDHKTPIATMSNETSPVAESVAYDAGQPTECSKSDECVGSGCQGSSYARLILCVCERLTCCFFESTRLEREATLPNTCTDKEDARVSSFAALNANEEEGLDFDTLPSFSFDALLSDGMSYLSILLRCH